MSDLAKGAEARLDTALAPAPPSGLCDADLSEDGRHCEPGTLGALLDFDHFGGGLLHAGKNVQECTVSQCRNAQSIDRAHVHNCGMADAPEDARAFLTRALEASGLKPFALAKKAGVAPTTITRPLNDPEFKFTPKPATLRKIAEAAGLDLPQGLSVAPSGPASVENLPMIGPIQAGKWAEIDESVQDEPVFFSVVADRRYPHARQWLREVKGDSMNARGVMPGQLAHIVDILDAGINLNTGMIVEVTRSRDDGALREITLKEVEISAQGIRLWPRSTNPRWTDPVILDDGRSGDIEVRITGLLLQAVQRFL